MKYHTRQLAICSMLIGVVFTAGALQAQSITCTEPTAGQICHLGDTLRIKWTTTGWTTGEGVVVDLSTDWGSSWTLITSLSTIPHEIGYFDYVVPNSGGVPSTACKVRLSNYLGNCVGFSDLFTLGGPIMELDQAVIEATGDTTFDVVVSNSGILTVPSLAAESDAAWLVPLVDNSPANGAVITNTVDTIGLNGGSHIAIVTVTGSDVHTKTYTVSLILEKPIIAVSADTTTVSGADTFEVTVSNAGPFTLPLLTATCGVSWLSVQVDNSPANGAIVTNMVDVSGLGRGIFYERVNLTGEGVDPAWYIVKVDYSHFDDDPGPPRLVGHWDFEAATVTGVPDVSGNGLDAVGTDVLTAEGISGKALRCIAADVDLAVPHSPKAMDFSTFTIEAWVYYFSEPGQGSGQKCIFGKFYYVYSDKEGYALGIDTDGYPTLTVAPMEGFGLPAFVECKGSVALEQYRWHHVSGTMDGAALKVYLDGRVVGQVDCAARLNYTDERASIGHRNNGGGWRLTPIQNAMLDDIRLHNYALPADSLLAHAQLYNADAYSVPDTSVLGSWDFEEFANNRFPDLSGLGYVGMATNVTTVPGLFGTAAQFSGSSSGIEIASSGADHNPARFTVETWLRPQGDALTGDPLGRIQTIFRSSVDCIEINLLETGHVSFCAGACIESPTVLGPFEWHHVAAVYDEAVGLQLYQDGRLVADTAYTGGYTWGGANSTIGTGVGNFVGEIEEFAFHNSALSAAAISDAYSQAAGNLIVSIPLDDYVEDYPVFAWHPENGVTSYRVQVSTSYMFTDTVLEGTVTDTTFEPATSLPRVQLYWRVGNAAGGNQWSAVDPFRVHSVGYVDVPYDFPTLEQGLAHSDIIRLSASIDGGMDIVGRTVTITAPDSGLIVRYGLNILNSTVTLENVVLAAGADTLFDQFVVPVPTSITPPIPCNAYPGDPALNISNSQVVLRRVVAQGSNADKCHTYYADGGPGVVAGNSTLQLYNCVFRGGLNTNDVAASGLVLEDSHADTLMMHGTTIDLVGTSTLGVLDLGVVGAAIPRGLSAPRGATFESECILFGFAGEPLLYLGDVLGLESCTIELYDLRGRISGRMKLSLNGGRNFHLAYLFSDLPKGIYVIKQGSLTRQTILK